jgi:protein-tyrosine phosphatase
MNIDHQQRILRLDGARNVRDLGGLPTTGGGMTRFGVVIRADGLSRLSDEDRTRLGALNLRTIIDLRYDEERERAPDRLPSGEPPGFYFRGFFPKGSDAIFHALNVRGAGAEEAAALMCANYARMPFDNTAEFRDVLHHIITPGAAPHLVHCTSGKDRTGLVVAFLLLALDVPREVIFDDYELSNGDWQPIDMFGEKATREAIDAIMAAPAQYLTAAFDAIEQRCGSVDDYLGQWLGFGRRERQALANLMLV